MGRERENQKFAAAVASGNSKRPRKHPLATENTEKIVYDSSQMWGVFPPVQIMVNDKPTM